METALVRLQQVLKRAQNEKYAVPMVNAYNLEWIKAIVLTAQERGSAVMVGVSHEAALYCGGYDPFVATVRSFVKAQRVTVPVFIHLDHGTYEASLLALAAGFDSIMYDGSALPLAENLARSRDIHARCLAQGVAFEAEVGTIGGKEDAVNASASYAKVEDCVAMDRLGVDMLAVGIGNIHGRYPPDWKGLDLALLQRAADATKAPLVLHGSSWVPDDQIRKAIALRVCKINISSELRDAFANATIAYCASGKAVGKGQDPRKMFAPGYEAMRLLLAGKLALFGSAGRY